MRIILLLSSIFTFLLSYEELFHYNSRDFDVIKNKTTYKLVLKNQQYFNYSLNGFKFFIPKFTKEFNLKILRYNSTGRIDGILSLDEHFSKILNISKSDLKYYLTDYKTSFRALDFLLKGYSIPYNDVTSISIEAYNIPKKIYSKLGKYFYFKIKHKKNNSLKYLVFSFYVVLDRKEVDKYLKDNHLTLSQLIDLMYYIKLKKIKKVIKAKKTKKKVVKRVSYSLYLYRLLYMKDFYIPPIQRKIKIKKYCDNSSLKEFKIKLENAESDLKNYIINHFILRKDNLLKIDEKLSDLIMNYPQNITCEVNILENSCFKLENNSSCFKNINYFNNYVNFEIKNNNLNLDSDTILAYGDYKTFNNIAKYFFERGDFQKSEVFLLKAYALKKDPIIIHNLAVLYGTHSPLYDVKKYIYYLKQSNFDIDYYNLGVAYYIGLGVKESDKKARFYFQKANGIIFAKKNLDIMKKYHIGEK